MPLRLDSVFLRKAVSFLAKIPFLSVVLLALFLQAVKEFYPFSHYSMFSVLTPDVEFYYLTDSQGKPVPQKTYFGFSTSWTRKMLNTRLAELSGGDNIDNASRKEVTEAGRQTLDYLVEHCEEPYRQQVQTGGLQLHQIFVENKDGRLLRKKSLIAEIPPRS